MMSILGKLRQRWLGFAATLGNIQMVILLSLLYWTMVTLVALPLRLVADPLALRRSRRVRWLKRAPVEDMLTSMRKQG